VQKKHLQIGGWMAGGEMCVFNGKLAISLKRWEITAKVAYKKWHTPFQMKWKSSTLDNLEGHWQPIRSAILATAGLLVMQRKQGHSVRFDACSWRKRRTKAKSQGQIRCPFFLRVFYVLCVCCVACVALNGR